MRKQLGAILLLAHVASAHAATTEQHPERVGVSVDASGETQELNVRGHTAVDITGGDVLGAHVRTAELIELNGNEAAAANIESDIATKSTCNKDKFSSHWPPNSDNGGSLVVSTICTSGKIAGPLEFDHLFDGPSPMPAVADPDEAGVIYFAYTEDKAFGTAEDGSEGTVWVEKVRLRRDQGIAWGFSNKAKFDGFVRVSDIAFANDGDRRIGVLMAKYVPKWVRSFLTAFPDAPEGNAPMMLAVGEVWPSMMAPTEPSGQNPWRIGKHWSAENATSFANDVNGEYPGDSVTAGYSGSYPVASYEAQSSAGYGWLSYDPTQRMWTTWYGSTWGTQTGSSMHTYNRDWADLGVANAGVFSNVDYSLPVDGVADRFEPGVAATSKWVSQDFAGQNGNGLLGSAMRYHPTLDDIGVMMVTEQSGFVKYWQYGLAQNSKLGMETLTSGGDSAQFAGSLRPCGQDWITAVVSDSGNVCAKVSMTGEVLKWNVIEPSVHTKEHSHGGFSARRASVQLAVLGSAEKDAKCERFLMGYVTEDKKRYLIEVDGECEKLTVPFDVSKFTTWPDFQEWTTTADGAVAWVTSWHGGLYDEATSIDPGNPNPTFDEYKPKPVASAKNSGGSPSLKTWGETPGAQDTAYISVFWAHNVAHQGDTAGPPDPNRPTPKPIEGVDPNCPSGDCGGEEWKPWGGSYRPRGLYLPALVLAACLALM